MFSKFIKTKMPKHPPIPKIINISNHVFKAISNCPTRVQLFRKFANISSIV